MAGLLIFIEIALAGCGFLLYFLYKLSQDSRKSRTSPRVEITALPPRPLKRGKILRLYSAGELAQRNSARKSRL